VSSAYGGAGSSSGMRNDSFRSSRDSLVSRRTYTARRGSNASLYDEEDDYYYGGSLRDVSYGGHSGRRKSSSANYLGPGSLPARHRRLGGGDFDDGASDISSTASGWSAYGYRSAGGGSRMGMYREPAAKSNRTIVMNAIEHVVYPGVVNRDTRMRVMEEIDALDCPHFLLLFRDTKCQFRGLYAYYPDTEEVFKIYGTGPKQVMENMFEKFFKYNSGGKKFTQIHTKSLSVTIDAFTIHNSLWLGKKTRLPERKDMALVV
jgi:calmodulin-regulated spectrin-associated protein